MVISSRVKRNRRYWLRLLVFLLIVTLALPLSIIIIIANAEALSYVVPSRSAVARSNDLPSSTQDVSFVGGDKLTLRGWYIPPQNGTVVILLHGYFADRTQMVFHALNLEKAGYGALLYDERGAGESDGQQRSFGWRDIADVGGALAFLKDKATSIAILGCSIGGQVALRAAAHYPQLRAILADGPAVVSTEDLPPATGWQDSLILRYDWFVDRLVEFHVGMTAPPSVMATINQIAPRPILIFAGALGGEKFRLRRYQQAAGSNAQLWEVPGGTHCDGPTTAPTEYASRMIEFFNSVQP